MKISREKFEQLLQSNQLIVSIIGMSNIGKTSWSKKLGIVGFRHINCDDLIEEKLAPVLKKLGYSGIEDVARWMGQPYEKNSPEHQQKYLKFEKESLQDIFAELDLGVNQNTVIDTTGSLVHTGQKCCENLRDSSLVVYIKATEKIKEKMFRRYMENPKPVIFGSVFFQDNNEPPTQALERCYKELLNLREKLYSRLADVTIVRDDLIKEEDADFLFSLIKKAL